MEHPENNEAYKGLVVNAGNNLHLLIPIVVLNPESVSFPWRSL